MGTNIEVLKDIDLRQRKEWDRLLMDAMGGEEEFDRLHTALRRYLKSRYQTMELDEKDLRTFELRDTGRRMYLVQDAEEFKKAYPELRSIKFTIRIYLYLIALGEPQSEGSILEAFSYPLLALMVDKKGNGPGSLCFRK